MQSVEKAEELKAQIARLKKQHAQELHEKLTKASKHSEDVEAEIQVLKEMIKSVKLQLKSKDTDIQRLNIKIKRLEKTAEIRENVIADGIKTKQDVEKKANSITTRSSVQVTSNSVVASDPSPRIMIPRKDGQQAIRSQQVSKAGVVLPPIAKPSQEAASITSPDKSTLESHQSS